MRRPTLNETAAFDALLANRLITPNTGILAPSAYPDTYGPVNPIGTGTGPFVLTKEVPGQSLSLVNNPNYWGGEVKIDEVEVLLASAMSSSIPCWRRQAHLPI